MLFKTTSAALFGIEAYLVEVEVEGLGRLSNRIVEGPLPIRTELGAQPTESEEVLSTALGGEWEFRGIRPPKKPGA